MRGRSSYVIFDMRGRLAGLNHKVVLHLLAHEFIRGYRLKANQPRRGFENSDDFNHQS